MQVYHSPSCCGIVELSDISGYTTQEAAKWIETYAMRGLNQMIIWCPDNEISYEKARKAIEADGWEKIDGFIRASGHGPNGKLLMYRFFMRDLHKLKDLIIERSKNAPAPAAKEKTKQVSF